MGFSRTAEDPVLPERCRLARRVLVFFTRCWRREFYLIPAGNPVLTVVAFFAMGGRTDTMSTVSKPAEAVVALTAGYLYTAE